MDILNKNIDLEVTLPLSTEDIDNYLKTLNIKPLRFSIVNINDNKVTINVAFENL